MHWNGGDPLNGKQLVFNKFASSSCLLFHLLLISSLLGIQPSIFSTGSDKVSSRSMKMPKAKKAQEHVVIASFGSETNKKMQSFAVYPTASQMGRAGIQSNTDAKNTRCSLSNLLISYVCPCNRVYAVMRLAREADRFRLNQS